MANIDQAHWPNTFEKIYVVNAPTVFRALWAGARRFLSQKVNDKITIAGSVAEVADEMVGELGAECLPTELGGTRQQAPPYHWGGKESEGAGALLCALIARTRAHLH